MICPNNGEKEFDDIDCQQCKSFQNCFKQYKEINSWEKDYTPGDNFPKMENEKKDKSLTDSERLMINALAKEIKEYGEQPVWDKINTMILESRMYYIELFLSAKRLLATGEY